MPLRSLLPFLLIFLLLRLVFWCNTFPNPDEAYYWLWGQHPSLSYYDHPPLQAWVQGFFTAIFGRSDFTLRLPNLISNAILFFTYYRISHYLYGKNANLAFGIIVLSLLSSPLYFLFLALAWHDHWLITFCLIAAFLFITFVDNYIATNENESWRLYGAATAIALAILCKYNAVFVILGCMITVIANPRSRPLLRDHRLYFAGAIVLSGLIPIVLWNFSNDWQSFRYYVDRSVNTGRFSINPLAGLGFWAISILTVSPFHCIGFLRGWQQSKNWMQKDSVYRSAAFWMFIISTATLTGISLISAALYYWNITAYLLLFPLLPAALLPSQSTASSQPRLFLNGQFYGLFFAILLVVHYSIVPLSAFITPDGDPDSRMLFGWQKVAAVVKTQAAELNNPILITTDYRSASALAYQLNNKTVIAISDRIDQFDFWYSNLAEFNNRNSVILADDWHPASTEFLSQFNQVSTTKVPITRFGIWIKNYYVLKGDRFKAD
jgi:4-amino-4-deoxy-L-arabinose transferase-like glycosyltransferase